jgi:UDP-glucose 4-epimerase
VSDTWNGRRVLITGGLGFLGSNLAIRLVGLGARVTLLDSMLPLYGGNLFNIAPIQDSVQVNFSDIRSRHSMNYLVQDRDIIFHLAGQVSHVDSLLDPFTDVEININGTLAVLESCRLYNPQAKIIFTGTRNQYGPSTRLPVDEEAPTNALGIYAINNLTAEKIVMMYHEVHALRSVCLRITNTYGPRHQMKHNRYGVLNWFIRQALDGKTIPVMGDGSYLRDFVYVDDVVAALIVAAEHPAAEGQIFNVGSGRGIAFRDLAQAVIDAIGGGEWEYVPFSAERKALGPSDFYADIGKIGRLLGWRPTIDLAEGLVRTAAFYREYRDHYWTPET